MTKRRRIKRKLYIRLRGAEAILRPLRKSVLKDLQRSINFGEYNQIGPEIFDG